MKDTRGDTYATSGDEFEKLILKPGATGDITSVRTTHNAKAVNVVVHTRKLRHDKMAMIDIVTSAKHQRRFMVAAVVGPGYKMIALTRGLDGDDISCRGLRVRVDSARGTIRAHVPRSCLDNPRWIRTGALLMTVKSQSGALSSIDVAGKKVLTNRWWNNADLQLPHGPRVHMG